MRLLIPCYDLSTIRNSLQENLELREIEAESGGQNVANSLYFSLLAANLGERLAPDCSLYHSVSAAEKFPLNRRRNIRNRPYFAIVSLKARAEKTAAE